jgi:N6-L-threonylcarbamoyladenine synthase
MITSLNPPPQSTPTTRQRTSSSILSSFPARVLGIESSCDETAAAVVEDGRAILSSLVASQADIHAQFGGVFPEVASRQHIRTIYAIIEQALQQAHIRLSDLDAIAVTRGPGLPGSLVVGMNIAKALSMASELPLIGINHLEAHIYSAWLDWRHSSRGGSASDSLKPEPRFPLLALIVSGGHTELVLMKDHLQYQRLGATLDDAAGEAFDKIARLLGLGYPGGPSIEHAAEGGNPKAFAFPRSWLEGTWNFSFSGLKTAVLREVHRIQGQVKDERFRPELPVADLAASFQSAVIDVLVGKTLQAAREFNAADILIAGGVSANRALRQNIQELSPVPVHIPHISLCTDNAAMIAGAGYYRYTRGQVDPIDLDVLPNWPLSEV